MDFKDEVRDNIIEVARSMFSRYGYKKTTVDDIAINSKKAKSSLYYYFKSKEEIFEAVVDKEADIIREKLLNVINNHKIKSINKLKEYIHIRMNSVRDMVNFYEAMKNEFLTDLDFIEKIRRKYDDQEIMLIENILISGNNENIFNIKDTKLTSLAIVTAMRGLEIPLFSEKHSFEEKVDGLLNILFYGIINK